MNWESQKIENLISIFCEALWLKSTQSGLVPSKQGHEDDLLNIPSIGQKGDRATGRSDTVELDELPLQLLAFVWRDWLWPEDWIVVEINQLEHKNRDSLDRRLPCYGCGPASGVWLFDWRWDFIWRASDCFMSAASIVSISCRRMLGQAVQKSYTRIVVGREK